jgi:crotonobetainyl-CoA:carnitine CoA-transferase CaiB-like acyl-CoA transferase
MFEPRRAENRGDKQAMNKSEEPAGPLAGVKVLDFCSFINGAYSAAMLGDLGAEVVKIEPLSGDNARAWGPFLKGESRFYQAWNRNKRCIALDLGSREGREIVYELVKGAVRDYLEFLNDPQVTAMEMNPVVAHSRIGPVRMAGVPIHFEKTPGRIQRAAPTLGEYTDEILGEIGFSDSRIEALREAGILLNRNSA